MATDINNKKRKAMTEEEKSAAVAAILAEKDSSDQDSEVGVVAEAIGVASATVPVMNPYIGDRGRTAASRGSVDSSEDMYRNYLLQQRQQLIEAQVLHQQQQQMQFAMGPGPNIIDKPTAKHKSKNYTKAEVTCLLKFYRAHKPVGRSGVERVRVGTVVSLCTIVPATGTVDCTNTNTTISSKNKNTTSIVTVSPSIIECLLFFVITACFNT